MNSYQLLESMMAALAADTQLAVDAVAWYGAAHQVYIDQDTANPPGKNDGFVLIQLHSPAKNESERERVKEHAFIVSIDVQDPADAARAEDNASEYAATSRLDTIVNRALTVMRAAKPEDCFMAYEYFADTVSNFPMFTADILIKFTQNLRIRPGDDFLG